jgi:tryptophanyl-tRNA synthetase
MNLTKKTVLSCIQPTGEMHLGNYLGAIKNWVALQADYECLYGVVDYHAMTMPYKAADLRQNTLAICENLVACGVAPSNLFIQSLVPEHTQLGWILSCVCGYSELLRMTQFKEKGEQIDTKSDQITSTGLFTYPVLQAADILIYKAELVPVGRDQEQHLELSRTIANRFNHQFDTKYFAEPQCLFTDIPKVQSLADPTKKMSKSLGGKHYIGLFENEASIRTKVKAAVTDDLNTPIGEMPAGVANLFNLLSVVAKDNYKHTELLADFHNGTLKYVHLKTALADVLVELTNEFKQRKSELSSIQIKEQVYESSAQIRLKAQATLAEVRDIVGLAI